MGELPLDDPRWYAMEAAINLRQQQTGAMSRAIYELERDMAGDKLRSMRRKLDSDECGHLSASFWKDHVIDASMISLGSVTYYRRTDIDSTPQRWGVMAHAHLATDRLDGWLFYVWKPDLDSLYFGARNDRDDDGDSKEPLQPIDRAKAALVALYPTKAEMPSTLRATTNAVDKECRKRGWQPVGKPDTVARAAGELGLRAPRKRPPRKRK